MELQRTPLYKTCIENGGRMVDFAGWSLPVQFSGLKNEHFAVRNNAGMFDISHMGVFLLKGSRTKDFLQKIVPTDLYRIGPGEACYTVLTNKQGGIIDDLIVYDLGFENNSHNILIVINAACNDSDLEWLEKFLPSSEIEISNAKDNKIFISLQGPQAGSLIEKLIHSSINELPRFGHKTIELKDKKSESIFIARTGYTGEDGFELLLETKTGITLWNEFINAGVVPCGLGARDTLRLEAGMHLYGHDMNNETTPFEAGLGWLVHLEMPTTFIGRESLENQAKQGIKYRLINLKLEDRAVPRTGYKVFNNDNEQVIGQITSGTWSPTLEAGIAMAYVPVEFSKIGTMLSVEIRGKQYPAQIVQKPFYRRP